MTHVLVRFLDARSSLAEDSDEGLRLIVFCGASFERDMQISREVDDDIWE